MKKLLIVIALVAILATGTAFADHPDGFGIGLVGSYGWGGGGGGLSLKIPSIPIYWGVFFWGYEDNFSLGVTGDYYLLDDQIVSILHWYLGLGGFFNFNNHTRHWANKDYSYSSFYLGARIPIGLSLQPIPLLEVFLDVAPSFGVHIRSSQKADDGHEFQKGGAGFAWGWPIEVGLRLWF